MSHKKGRGGGGKSSGISWNKQKSEPKFIREFKERIAYKEQASIETKVKFIYYKLASKKSL